MARIVKEVSLLFPTFNDNETDIAESSRREAKKLHKELYTGVSAKVYYNFFKEIYESDPQFFNKLMIKQLVGEHWELIRRVD